MGRAVLHALIRYCNAVPGKARHHRRANRPSTQALENAPIVSFGFKAIIVYWKAVCPALGASLLELHPATNIRLLDGAKGTFAELNSQAALQGICEVSPSPCLHYKISNGSFDRIVGRVL